MTHLGRDLRYAMRLLFRTPAFTLVALVALGLGIGANTAIFTVVNAVLLRPVPVKDPDRAMVVWETFGERVRRASVTAPDFVDWRAGNKVFESIAAQSYESFSLTGSGDPERLPGARISAAFFPLLGIEPILGRGFSSEEDRSGAAPVVLLSHGLWQRRFGGDPGVLGKNITLDREIYTVVGVMPSVLRLRSIPEELWVPLALTADDLMQTGNHRLVVLGRLRGDVSREQAEAEMRGIAKCLESVRPWSNKNVSVRVVPLFEQIVSDSRQSLGILLGAVGLVLLIACANVANLLLGRAMARQREIAVRMALGATRGRLLGQLLTESVLLSLAGGLLGLLLAFWMTDSLVAVLPSNIPRLQNVAIEARVLGFTLGLSLATGLIFGLAPAFQASHTILYESLREGAPTVRGGRRWLRAVLVVAEVSLSLALIVGAGLLVRSFLRLRSVDPGFRPQGLVAAQVALPAARYGTHDQVNAFYDQALERLRAIPGAETVGATSSLPFGGGGVSLAFYIEGRPRPQPGSNVPNTYYRAVSPDYFRALPIRLLRGRGISERDRPRTPRIGVINETLARRYFPGQDPIGQRMTLDDLEKTPMEIVGVVGDIKHFGLDSPPAPEVYFPYAQAPPIFLKWTNRSLNLIVRSAQPDVIPAVRQTIWSIDRDLPVYNTRHMEQLVEQSTTSARVYMALLSLFAAAALVLAAIGLYGVIAYSVSQRTREIGVRIAMGARRADVMRLVIGEGFSLGLAGVGLGMAGAFAGTRLLRTLLFEVEPTDPLTFAAVSAGLLATTLAASLVPALRATRVDPMVALRYE